MLDVVYTSQFKRDYRLAMRRHLDIAKLDAVIKLLANQEPLSPNYRDHQLSGKWAKFRELGWGAKFGSDDFELKGHLLSMVV